MIKFNSHNHYDNCEGCKAIRAEALEEAAVGIDTYSLGALKAIVPDVRAAAVAKILADAIRFLASGPPDAPAAGQPKKEAE